MDLIIAVLIWIGAVTPGGVYTQTEFDHLVMAHQPVITAVAHDPALQDHVYGVVGTNRDVVIGEGD
jgi:hypothetical protein